jgi:hypothetical protein
MTNYDMQEIDGIGGASDKPVTATDLILGAVAVLGIAALVYLLLFL